MNRDASSDIDVRVPLLYAILDTCGGADVLGRVAPAIEVGLSLSVTQLPAQHNKLRSVLALQKKFVAILQSLGLFVVPLARFIVDNNRLLLAQRSSSLRGLKRIASWV